jgi:hypothetical protein
MDGALARCVAHAYRAQGGDQGRCRGDTIHPLVGDGNAVTNSLVEIEEVKHSSRGSSVIQVEASSLDSQQTALVSAMIKIDTEGSELWVCEGQISGTLPLSGLSL